MTNQSDPSSEVPETLEIKPYGVLCTTCNQLFPLGYAEVKHGGTVEDLRESQSAKDAIGKTETCESADQHGRGCGSTIHVERNLIEFVDESVMPKHTRVNLP